MQSVLAQDALRPAGRELSRLEEHSTCESQVVTVLSNLQKKIKFAVRFEKINIINLTFSESDLLIIVDHLEKFSLRTRSSSVLIMSAPFISKFEQVAFVL